MSRPIFAPSGGNGGSGISPYWDMLKPPASPSVYDDEFLTNAIAGNLSSGTGVLNGKWRLPAGGTLVDGIDDSATPSSGAYNIDITGRDGCIRVQPGVGYFDIEQDVTLPTNCSISARLSATTRHNSFTNADTNAALVLFNAAKTKYLILDLPATVSGPGLQNGIRFIADSGAVAQFNVADRGLGMPVEWATIRKLGSTYEAWVSPLRGSRTYIGRITGYTETMTLAVLRAQNASTGTPGAMTLDLGPFRFINGSKMP